MDAIEQLLRFWLERRNNPLTVARLEGQRIELSTKGRNDKYAAENFVQGIWTFGGGIQDRTSQAEVDDLVACLLSSSLFGSIEIALLESKHLQLRWVDRDNIVRRVVAGSLLELLERAAEGCYSCPVDEACALDDGHKNDCQPLCLSMAQGLVWRSKQRAWQHEAEDVMYHIIEAASPSGLSIRMAGSKFRNSRSPHAWRSPAELMQALVEKGRIEIISGEPRIVRLLS